MTCLSRTVECLSNGLERMGLYEPKLTIRKAKERLNAEARIWDEFKHDRSKTWLDFQKNKKIEGVPQLIQNGLDRLVKRNISVGIAVDLGCGISSATISLLQKGWKVYAVDNSQHVLDTFENIVNKINRTWIKNKQLVLVCERIETFTYPEKVHFIFGKEALPYCDPRELCPIFSRAKEALFPYGVLSFNFLSYYDGAPKADNILRTMFGGWLTRKNIIDALVESFQFSSSTVYTTTSRSGAKQFNVIAELGETKEKMDKGDKQDTKIL